MNVYENNAHANALSDIELDAVSGGVDPDRHEVSLVEWEKIVQAKKDAGLPRTDSPMPHRA
jgi:hypothetical protein